MLTHAVKYMFSKIPFRGASTFMKGRLYDATQEAFLDETCLLVDEKDNIIGTASKRECHLVQTDGTIPLHRALSVFLFNMRGDLLLQKRSDVKITYPGMYTNTCCSHPVVDHTGEDDEENAMGVKRAARRRLNYELGIPLDQLELEDLKYITRIHYKDIGNGKWGEHEIDYVLFIQKNVKLKPNPNEISEISFVPRKGLDEYLPTLTSPLTPWFHLIVKHRLRYWWDHLDSLNDIKDHKNIFKFVN